MQSSLVTFVALTLSALNWLLFATITFRHDLPMLDRLARRASGDHAAAPCGFTDDEKLLDGAGALAGAFRRASAAPRAWTRRTPIARSPAIEKCKTIL